MSILFMDGFDAYGGPGVSVGAQMAAAGWSFSGSVTSTDHTSGPQTQSSTRTGIGYSLWANWQEGAVGLYVSGPVRNFSPVGSVVVSFALLLGSPSFDSIIQVGYNDLAGSVTDHIRMFYNLQDGITITNAHNRLVQPNEPGDVIAASPPNVIFPGTWQFIEMMFTPKGVLQVRVDGVMVINVSGCNSTDGLATSINYVSLINGSPTARFVYDDFYLSDQGAGAFNTFQGDVVVHAVFPNADATPNQWSKVGGSTPHYTAIDETPSDEDTSYLYSSTSGQQELFNLAAFPADIIDVLAVGVNIRARKDTAGFAFYKANLKVSSTEADSGPIVASQGYITSQTIFEAVPGGGAWTTSAAQNAKIGFSIP